MDFSLCFIKEKYFIDNSNFVNLKEDIKPYGRIGHMIPSKSRSDACFDYRYSLIINNSSYIEPQTTPPQEYQIHNYQRSKKIYSK